MGALIPISALAMTVFPQAVAAPTVEVIEPSWYDVLQDHPVLREIALCESGSRQFNDDGSVVTGRINPKDIGILQINLDYHGRRAEELGIDLRSLGGNIRFGIILYEEQGTAPWIWSKPCWEKKVTA